MWLLPTQAFSQNSARAPRQSSRWLPTGRCRPALVLVAMLAGLASCIAPTPPAPKAPPAPVPPAVPATPADPAIDAQLEALLAAAEQALAEDRLTTPPEDNAYRYYMRALALAPEQPAAARGIERIVERYLELAARAIERQRWASARSMLARATVVDRHHSGIGPLQRQVEMLAAAERRSLRLDRAALRARSGALAARLAAFGSVARQRGARVTIRAPSDADARWIYAQLSRAAGDWRIRASIDIGLPPQVDVVVLPAADG